jgi:predicted DsbA family dithiol-disulfide isomerase
MDIEIFADIVCPWCYIGERRFEQARTRLAGEVELRVMYRPFQLDAGAPAVAAPLQEYLHKRYGFAAASMQAQAGNAAASAGITVNWDRALAVNTKTAHRLMRLARLEYDDVIQRALLEELFAAHFTNGVDIADHGELARIAEKCGLNAERVRSYLEMNEGAAELEREFAEAHQLGIQGVPAFVIDRMHLLEGAQSAETFVHVLRDLHAQAA